jgi:hypothetical protein
MRISVAPQRRTVGREDRLVRSCVALSLLLLGGFALATSGAVGVVTVGFALGAAYFALTAVLGWDPIYARTGIDTRTDAEIEADLSATGPDAALATTVAGEGWAMGTAAAPVDGTGPAGAPGAEQPWGTSLLGG